MRKLPLSIDELINSISDIFKNNKKIEVVDVLALDKNEI